MVFHWIWVIANLLSSPWISFLDNFSSTIVWIILNLPLISSFPSPFSRLLGTVPRAPTTIWYHHHFHIPQLFQLWQQTGIYPGFCFLLFSPAHWHSGYSVHQWSRRSGFNPRSSHTKDLKKWYLMPPCLTHSIIRYESKQSNLGNGIVRFLTPLCRSY